MHPNSKGPKSLLPYMWRFFFQPGYTLFSCTDELWKAYGDIVLTKVPYLPPLYVVSDPDLIGKVLMGTEKTNRKTLFYDRLKVFLGEGLLSSSGETWRSSRRLATPAFHSRMLDSLIPIMQEETEKMLDAWELKLGRQGLVNFSSEMTQLTLAIICRVLFSVEFSGKAASIREAVSNIQELANHLFFAPFLLPSWIPTRFNRQIRKGLKVLDAEVYQLIDEHRRHPDRYQDLLSVYLATRDEETGKGMSDRQIRDEILTLLVAGHESTAATITFGFAAIAAAPEVKSKLKEEYQAVPLTRSSTAENYKDLTYTNMVAQEVLRLYPAIWSVGRELKEDMTFKGQYFPKGSNMILMQYTSHRHPAYWQEPERFLPERFSAENSKSRHPFVYFPFGGGARNCLGMGLAKLEIQVVFSSILRRFDILPVENSESFKMIPRITTISDRPIILQVQKTHAAGDEPQIIPQ